MLNVLQCTSEELQCGHSIHACLQLGMRYSLVDGKLVEINVTHIGRNAYSVKKTYVCVYM